MITEDKTKQTETPNDSRELLDRLRKKAAQLEADANAFRKLLEKFEHEFLRVDYSSVDGVVGRYDGRQLIAEDGTRYDVPGNYAAKSKVVYGDTLKMIQEGDRQVFKHIGKVDRKKVYGILTKKEGDWYLLSDTGSYKILDVAAEFQKAQMNSEASAYIPATMPEAPFAALDTITGSGIGSATPVVRHPAPALAVQSPEKPVPASAPRVAPKSPEKPRRTTTVSQSTTGVARTSVPAKPRPRPVTPRAPQAPAPRVPAQQVTATEPIQTVAPAAPLAPTAPAAKPAIQEDDLV